MLVTLHCQRDLDKILTSEPARLPLAPLSTQDSCLDCEVWSTNMIGDMCINGSIRGS